MNIKKRYKHEIIRKVRERYVLNKKTGQVLWNPKFLAKSNRRTNTIPGTEARGGRSVFVSIHLHSGRKTTMTLAAVAWILLYNELPDPYVMNIDRDPRNNKPSNLIEASRRELNILRHRKVKTLPGTQKKGPSRWVAKINRQGKQKYLGTFKTEKEAHKAYLAASREGGDAVRLVYQAPGEKNGENNGSMD